MNKIDIAEAAVEVAGTSLALVTYTYAAIFTQGDESLLWFMAAGTIGGAVLSAMGGKAFGILDMGTKTLVAKITANICVVMVFGPMALGWALTKFNGMADPQAIAAAVGGSLALFGTSALILIVPTLAKWLQWFLWKRIPAPPTIPEPQQPDSPPSQ